MKQFQFEYNSYEQFRNELIKIKQWKSSHVISKIVFKVYSTELKSDVFIKMFQTIDDILPEALYLGCSTFGNIIDGGMSKSDIIIICTIFEYPSTKIKILQYDFDDSNLIDKLIEEVDDNPWVSAVEFLVTMRGHSMTKLCERMSEIREGISIFGGGAFAPDINSDEACVYSKSKGYSDDGIVFMFLGGEDLQVDSMYITGWKPLGREFHVTSADGCVLKTLDNKPAYDAYYKYLHIKNDENFFANTLEFPFIYSHNGIDILRAPVSSNDDGSLVMTSDMNENVNARIAYGDPWTILASVNQGGERVRAFQPEVIHIFSCAARKTFWGDDEACKETMPFQSIAPTSGFFTSAEFLRTGKFLNQHNVTLVIASMREGAKPQSHDDFIMQEESFSGKVSMINRLATFIEAATEELEETNRKLALAVVTDGMTRLLNRAEISRLINEAAENNEPDLCLAMLDIDNFKSVNDTYGHSEGDNVIIALSDILRDVSEKNDNVYAGRWGGEEFMIMFKGYELDKAVSMAENIRERFAEAKFRKSENKTVSIGVTAVKNGESADDAFLRVDNALYLSKEKGKNMTTLA